MSASCKRIFWETRNSRFITRVKLFKAITEERHLAISLYGPSSKRYSNICRSPDRIIPCGYRLVEITRLHFPSAAHFADKKTTPVTSRDLNSGRAHFVRKDRDKVNIDLTYGYSFTQSLISNVISRSFKSTFK